MDHWIDTGRIFNPVEIRYPLIHMTQSWKILELILKEGLKPSYCCENITNGREWKEACFPMISTSNVGVDCAISHMKSYGTFGIILSKAWGAENDFNPVLYLESKSDLTNDIIDNFKNITAPSEDNLENALNNLVTNHKSFLTRQLIKVFAHSKNYDGILLRKYGTSIKNYPFGVEREWRKVIRQDKVPYFLVGDDINKKSEFNKILSGIRVDYSIKHLEGIIVEEEWQMERVKEIILAKFKLNEFPPNITIRFNHLRYVPDEG